MPFDDLALRRAQQGEARAWRDLVERYQRPIHALIYRLVAGRAKHRVPDLVQETFVRVLRALPEFDPAGPASLQTWMLTIATRLALNELRREPMVALGSDPIAIERTDAPIERARLAAAIERAMARLSDEHRAVIVLREYHELSYEELADALAIDVGTVKSRLARARATLREQLQGVRP